MEKIDNYQDNSMMSTNLNDLIAYSEEIYKEYIGIIDWSCDFWKKRIFRKKLISNKSFVIMSGIRAAFYGIITVDQEVASLLEERKF